MNILLVDDVEFFIEVQKDLLKPTRATIQTARNGQEALERVALERPDLIFMDVNMPVMDGITCCRILKANPEHRSIPVIMVFAPSRETGVDDCRAAGCDGVLTKPLDRRAFLEVGRRFHPIIERREPRCATSFAVTVRVDGKSFEARGVNLSQNGLFLETVEKLAAEARLKLSLQLPGLEGLELNARVAWENSGPVRSSARLPQGVGVEFRLLRAEAAQRIARVLGGAGIS
ncbi:two-component system response regulator [Desulfuromonas versatilis]|uniref:Two-component system response regulator n=1 Tax=Desulfuromonas versatilis TaxID=2802975 RepID=A0ABM8HTP7_9BACT|nr:response regulator [Desulfuromonas versatilis]BCR05350.1 two-component system response regulator [Desulfuromonas versatilis]